MSPAADSQDFGLKVQSPRLRLRKEEVRRRVLSAAAAMLHDSGVVVGLHHVNMEELIRVVGVPRSSAFAAFGGKEELITELMVELLVPADGQLLLYSTASSDIAQRTLASLAPRVHRADGSYDEAAALEVLREVVRVTIAHNAAEVATSPQWQTYMALSVSTRSLDDVRRARVEAALRESVARFTAKLVEFYAGVLPAARRRLRPGVTWELLATAGAAIVEGMVGRRLAGSEAATEPVPGPGLDGTTAMWDPVALAYLAVLEGLTEPE